LIKEKLQDVSSKLIEFTEKEINEILHVRLASRKKIHLSTLTTLKLLICCPRLNKYCCKRSDVDIKLVNILNQSDDRIDKHFDIKKFYQTSTKVDLLCSLILDKS